MADFVLFFYRIWKNQDKKKNPENRINKGSQGFLKGMNQKGFEPPTPSSGNWEQTA